MKVKFLLMAIILLAVFSCKKNDAEDELGYESFDVSYEVHSNDTIEIRYMEGDVFTEEIVHGDWSKNTVVRLREDHQRIISCVGRWCDTLVTDVDISISVIGVGDDEYHFPQQDGYCLGWSGAYVYP